MSKKIPANVRVYITQCLACYDPPSVVAAAVRDEFGIDVPRQTVEYHDPTKYAGRTLAKTYVKLFEDTRRDFLDESKEISISHRPVRLRALERMARRAESQGNMVLAAQLFEQAAKEVGDAYTNRRKMETDPNDPMTGLLAALSGRTLRPVTDDEGDE